MTKSKAIIVIYSDNHVEKYNSIYAVIKKFGISRNNLWIHIYKHIPYKNCYFEYAGEVDNNYQSGDNRKAKKINIYQGKSLYKTVDNVKQAAIEIGVSIQAIYQALRLGISKIVGGYVVKYAT